MKFNIGDKIKCINIDGLRDNGPLNMGYIYTISHIDSDTNFLNLKEVGLLFSYRPSRFELDLSSFMGISNNPCVDISLSPILTPANPIIDLPKACTCPWNEVYAKGCKCGGI